MVVRQGHTGADPKTFNPLTATDATSSNYAEMLFLGLVEHDPDTYEIVPYLAESFELKDSGKRILVKLRDDIFWSNGVKITADDVVYTWNDLLRDGIATSSLKDILSVDGEFPQVRKISEREIEFKTKKVFAPFLDSLGTNILPKHAIEAFFEENEAKTFEDKQKAFNNYLNIYMSPEKIVSSGPYLFERLDSGERIVLKKNPLFFLKDKEGVDLPYADKMIYTFSKDTTAGVFKFLADEIYFLGVTPKTAALMKSLEDRYNFKLFENGPSSGTNFFWFNLSKNVPEPKYSWFNNKEFRRAVSYAIDRQAIINNVFEGLAAPLYTAEPLKSPFFDETIEEYPRDMNKAKAILKEQGFNLKDGILYDAKGNKVEFDFYTNSGTPERELMAVIVKSNLEELGIKTNIKILEFNNFVGKLMQGKDYDAGIIALTGGNEPNGGANVWKSDGRLHLFDVKKFQDDPVIRPWEKEVDRLFNAGVQTLDFDERKAIYSKFQRIIYEENPLIYLVSPLGFGLAKNYIRNVKKHKYGGLVPHNYSIFVEN